MASLLYRLGILSARRPWAVIVAWILLLCISAGTFATFAGPTSSAITVPGIETQKVQDRLAAALPQVNGNSGASGTVVFETTDGEPFTDPQQQLIEKLLGQLREIDSVDVVTSGFEQQTGLDDQRDQLDQTRQELLDQQSQLEQSRADVNAQQQTLAQQEQQLTSAQQQLSSQRTQAEQPETTPADLARLDETGDQLALQQQQLAEKQTQLDAAKQELQNGQATVNEQRTLLDDNAELLSLSQGIRFVAEDGSAATATVKFDVAGEQVTQSTKDEILALADDPGMGVQMHVSADIAASALSILGPGEIIGVIVAAIVLVLMLRTAIGAALPLASAVLGIAVATLAALSFSDVVEFIAVTPALGVMLGLAVGIDYSLFILNRHRLQLKQGMSLFESIGLANGTAGNAVIFAGSTVIVALLALNITGIPFLGLMGTVGAAAVLVAIMVAVTFTPALLSLVGDRIRSRSERRPTKHSEQLKNAAAPMSSRRAIATLLIGVVGLGVISLPALDMRLGLPSAASEAENSTQYKAYAALDEKFGAGTNSPLLIVATLPDTMTTSNSEDADDQSLTTLNQVTIAKTIAALDDVAAIAPVDASEDNLTLAFQVIPTEGPDSQATEVLVKTLRDTTVDLRSGEAVLGVAGNASANIDISEKLSNALPLYLGVVVGLSLIILVLVFRSILVPLTATLGFVLSVAASFGALTAIYQFGWLGSIFEVHNPAPIVSFLPILVVGILFGLAMDYQLFLVSGMREAYTHGADARSAVQHGLRAGRTVVTAAAIIMIAVFAGFIHADSPIMRPIGFGLAFGVLVDAFIVRLLLIPAVMHLLGSKAWWLPAWLEKILPDVDVEGAKLQRVHPMPDRDQDDEPEGLPGSARTGTTTL